MISAEPIFQTKDSGERVKFDTGAHRDAAAGKGRFDLLPMCALHRWAQLMERGADKYGDRNWEQGIPLSSFLSSAFRHLAQLADGECDEDHAAAVLFNVGGYIWTLHEIRHGRLPAHLADGAKVTKHILADNIKKEAGRG